MPLDPNLAVSLLTPDEAETYVHIRNTTFLPTVNQILYSRAGGNASAATLARVAQETRTNIAKGVIFLKCVDTRTGEIVAAARWRYVKPKTEGAKERTWEEVEEGFNDLMTPYEETEPAMLDALFALFNGRKREYLGNRPYYVLDTLVTLGQHERRGAGSLLVKWGCDRADEQGVEAYLEASEMGEPMYRRHGFESKGVMELDLRKYGGKEVMRFIVSMSGSEWDGEMWTDICVANVETKEGGAGCLEERVDYFSVAGCSLSCRNLRKSKLADVEYGENGMSGVTCCEPNKSRHNSSQVIHTTRNEKVFVIHRHRPHLQPELGFHFPIHSLTMQIAQRSNAMT
jgi:hypothetical protein